MEDTAGFLSLRLRSYSEPLNQEQARSKNAESARAAEHQNPQSRNAPTPNPQPRTSKKQDEGVPELPS